MTLRESRDAWLRDRRRLQLSPETRKSYRQSTDEFLAVVGADRAVGSLTIEDLDRYLDLLDSDARARGPLTPATKAGRIARVRAWLNWAHDEGDLATPLGQRLQPPPLAVTTPPPLPPDQIRAMLSQVGLRHQALLLILLDTGLRIGDALRLRRTDLRRSQDGQPYFEVAISNTHSGGQAPISATTEKALRRYLARGRMHSLPARTSGGMRYRPQADAAREESQMSPTPSWSPSRTRIGTTCLDPDVAPAEVATEFTSSEGTADERLVAEVLSGLAGLKIGGSGRHPLPFRRYQRLRRSGGRVAKSKVDTWRATL